MKKIIFILIIASVFTGCNNDKVDKPSGVNQLPDTEMEMKAAIIQYPDSFLLKENLIQYYRDNGNYKPALEITGNAIIKDSMNPKLWGIIGTLHFENGDTLDALKAFEKAVAIFPDPKYMKPLGVLYAETKNSKALKMADILQLDNKSDAAKEAIFIKGLFYNYSGEKQKAIAFFDQCLACDYSFMNAYREKAVALYDLAKYEEALNVLNKATTLQNAFDEGYYWKGLCYEKLQRIKEAIENYKMAVQAAQKNNDDNIDARQALERLGVK